MLFEKVLYLVLLLMAIFMIGVPLTKLVKMMIPQKPDPLLQAREELERAQKEAEAARLKREAEKIYSSLYNETLENESQEENRKRL